MTDSNNNYDQGSVLGEIQAVWERRKWLIISAFSIPFTCVISLIFSMPDFYRAKATILVQQGQVGDLTDTYEVGQLESRLQAISENIFSRKRLQDLISRFDLYPELRELEPPANVIERMRKDIRVERKMDELRWGQDTTVAFTLSYQGWDPKVVAEVTNTIASMYVEENEKLRPRKVVTTPDTAVVVDPLTQLKQELAQLRTRYSEKYPDVVRVKEEIVALQRQREDSERSSKGVTESRLKKSNADSSKQFRIIDTALVPTGPIAPSRNRLVVVGIILALGLTGIIVLMAEQFDTSFHRPDELAMFTQMPVLAAISPILTRADVWRQRLRFGVSGLLILIVTSALVNASHVIGQSSSQLVWMLAQRGI